MKLGDTQRQLLLGGGTILGAVVFLAIIVIVQYITLQHPKRWDLTGAKRHTLAPQSVKILDIFRKEKRPIEVLAFYNPLEERAEAAKDSARELLDQYRDVYSDLTYTFIDPDKQRALAKQHGIDSYPTLVFKTSQKEERINTVTEETITNALAKLLRSDVRKVCFLKGHGELTLDSKEEDGLRTAKEQIEKQNYKTEELVLLEKPSVPEDCTVLVIAGPKADLVDAEIESIREYVKRGGRLMVLFHPFKSPKLVECLKEYGIEAGDDIVVDLTARAKGYDFLYPIIMTYIRFPITENFTLAAMFPESRSVKASKNPVKFAEPKELALTSPASWTISEAQLRSGKADFDEKAGIKGPVPVMAVSLYTNLETLEKAQDSKKQESQEKQPPPVEGQEFDAPGEKPKSEQTPAAGKGRVVVLGSALLAVNKVILTFPGNRDLFLNTISWLAEDEHLISIRPKSTKAEPLILSPNQWLTVIVIPVILMPLAWLLAGIGVYLSRRRTVGM